MKKLIAIFLFSLPLFAQVQVAPFVNPKVQFFNAGSPCSGCKLNTYAAGTTTQQATYSDSLGTTPNANPVVMDSNGFATIYLTSQSYKFVLTTSAGVTIWTQDSVSWNNLASTLSALTVAGAGPVTINSATAATSGANQSGPQFQECGNFWNGSASGSDCWSWQDVLGTGTNPTSTLTLTHSGSSGVANFFFPAVAFGQTDSTGYIINAKDLTSTTLSTLHIAHFSTQSGAYGLEEHGYNSCGLNCNGVQPTANVGAQSLAVFHWYSQLTGTPAVQIDSTGPGTILALKNAVNSVTSFNTKGTSNFIDFSGFSSGSPNTPVALAHLSNNMQWGTDDATTTITYGDGVAANSGVGAPRAALAVSSANGSFSAVSITESTSNLYGVVLNAQNFGVNNTCATNSGECEHIEKDGVGAGIALSVVNKGTGNSIQVTDGTNTTFSADATGHLLLRGGISQGSGFKHQRFGATCTLAASAGATCTTTYSWTSAFADANYTPICTAGAPSTGTALWNISSFTASGVTVILTSQGLASTIVSFTCVGIHD